MLQGDVGSGKTLVTLVAMLTIAETSAQAAASAPTEVLARQHHASLSALLRPLHMGIGFWVKVIVCLPPIVVRRLTGTIPLEATRHISRDGKWYYFAGGWDTRPVI